MNPDRYAVIYNSKYDNNESVFDNSSGTAVAAAISSSPFTSTSTKPQNQDIAKTILNGLLNQLVDKTMVAVIK